MSTKLLREILGAKVRFVAITLVVMIGVMIFIASSMSYQNLKTSYEYTYQKLNFADFTVKSDQIPRYVADQAAKVPGVTLSTPRTRSDVSMLMPDGKKLIGRVTGIPYQRPMVDDLLVKVIRTLPGVTRSFTAAPRAASQGATGRSRYTSRSTTR